jgi:hypothetical protein
LSPTAALEPRASRALIPFLRAAGASREIWVKLLGNGAFNPLSADSRDLVRMTTIPAFAPSFGVS